MGEFVTTLSAAAAYRLWAPNYDRDPNPLLALERRILSERLRFAPGDLVIDIATGTGRWLHHALSQGVRAVGLDASSNMLEQAAKPAARGRLVQGDLRGLPFADAVADFAICSFGLGYVSDARAALSEMARVSRCVILSDLHPAAAGAGWKRSFVANGVEHSVAFYPHTQECLSASAHAAKLELVWSVEACFDEPERGIFAQAGKLSRFAALRTTPAILVTAWERA